MAGDFNRFEITRKGYEPSAVERELRELNAQLLRLSTANTELTDRLRSTSLQLSQSEAALEATKSPNFAALGAKAANILSSAQQIASELELDAQQVAEQILSEANSEAENLRASAQQHYDSVVNQATRRAQRKIAAAEQDADREIAKAKTRAAEIIAEAEREAARLRGMVATEVAAMRSRSKREIAAKEAESEATRLALEALALEGSLTGEEKLSKAAQKRLDATLALVRAETEAEHLESNQKTIAEAEHYLDLAKTDMATLSAKVAELRLELDTLELEATKTQKQMIAQAKDKAEALVAAAELEAAEITSEARELAQREVTQASAEVRNLKNQAAAIEIYLENLRSLVTGELSRRSDGTAI